MIVSRRDHSALLWLSLVLTVVALAGRVDAQEAERAQQANDPAAVSPGAGDARGDGGAEPQDPRVEEADAAPAEAEALPATPGEPVAYPEAPIYPEGYSPPSLATDYTEGAYPEDDFDFAGGPGAREHEGFFLRLSIGPGAGRSHYREAVDGVRTSSVEASGLAGMFDVGVGGRVVGNLIVHGNLMFTRFDSPTRRVDGVKDAALGVTASATMVGAGASYYFMPLNVYLSSSLGMAWAFEKRGGEQLRTGTGGFVAFAAGKEWWVGRSGEWGIGAALRATFAFAPLDIAGVDSTLKLGNIGVAFSATFN